MSGQRTGTVTVDGTNLAWGVVADARVGSDILAYGKPQVGDRVRFEGNSWILAHKSGRRFSVQEVFSAFTDDERDTVAISSVAGVVQFRNRILLYSACSIGLTDFQVKDYLAPLVPTVFSNDDRMNEVYARIVGYEV